MALFIYLISSTITIGGRVFDSTTLASYKFSSLLFFTSNFHWFTNYPASPCTASFLKIPSLYIELTPLPILVDVRIFELIGRFFNAVTNFWNIYKSSLYAKDSEFSSVIDLFSLILVQISKIDGTPPSFINFKRAGWSFLNSIIISKKSIWLANFVISWVLLITYSAKIWPADWASIISEYALKPFFKFNYSLSISSGPLHFSKFSFFPLISILFLKIEFCCLSSSCKDISYKGSYSFSDSYS